MPKPKNLKVYVGTYVVAAKSQEAARREFDQGTAHICEEDGNPYHVMLDWKPSADHRICAGCGRVYRIVEGGFDKCSRCLPESKS